MDSELEDRLQWSQMTGPSPLWPLVERRGGVSVSFSSLSLHTTHHHPAIHLSSSFTTLTSIIFSPPLQWGVTTVGVTPLQSSFLSSLDWISTLSDSPTLPSLLTSPASLP